MVLKGLSEGFFVKRRCCYDKQFEGQPDAYRTFSGDASGDQTTAGKDLIGIAALAGTTVVTGIDLEADATKTKYNVGTDKGVTYVGQAATDDSLKAIANAIRKHSSKLCMKSY